MSVRNQEPTPLRPLFTDPFTFTSELDGGMHLYEGLHRLTDNRAVFDFLNRIGEASKCCTSK